VQLRFDLGASWWEVCDWSNEILPSALAPDAAQQAQPLVVATPLRGVAACPLSGAQPFGVLVPEGFVHTICHCRRLMVELKDEFGFLNCRA
jgi:hypothetical protein